MSSSDAVYASAGELTGIVSDAVAASATALVPTRLLSPDEVASALAISRDHVFKLMRAGELPFVRVGRLYRVSESDLRHFVEARRSGATPAPALRVRLRTAAAR